MKALSLIVLLSGLSLILTGCRTAFVPYIQGREDPRTGAHQDPGVESVIYKGAYEEKARQARSYMIWLLGVRDLRSAEWNPVGRQVSLSGELVWLLPGKHWGVESSITGSFMYEEEQTATGYVTNAGSTLEISMGPCYEFAIGDSPFRVIAGLGPSWISAGLSSDLNQNPVFPDDYDEDTAWGLYAHMSLALELGTIRLGVDLRTLNFTRINLFDTSSSADYYQVTFLFGYDY